MIISNKFVTIKTNRTTNTQFASVKIPYKTTSPKGTDISNYKFIVNDFVRGASTTDITIKADRNYHLVKTTARPDATPIDPIAHRYSADDLITTDGYITGSDLIKALEVSNENYKKYKEEKYQEFLSSVAFF